MNHKHMAQQRLPAPTVIYQRYDQQVGQFSFCLMKYVHNSVKIPQKPLLNT